MIFAFKYFIIIKVKTVISHFFFYFWNEIVSTYPKLRDILDRLLETNGKILETIDVVDDIEELRNITRKVIKIQLLYNDAIYKILTDMKNNAERIIKTGKFE